MKRFYGFTLGLAAVLSLCATSCDQPKMSCTTGHGGFAMKFTLRGSKTGTGTCDTLKSDIVGLEKYNPHKPDDPTHQDLTKATLAMRTKRLGLLALDAQADGLPIGLHDSIDSIGDFTSTEPNDKDVCTVPKLTTAKLKLDGVMTPTVIPPTDVTYTWSDISVYATPAYPGTQLKGVLTYTETDDTQNTTCSATYDVIGLYPAVDCGVYDDSMPPKVIGTDPTLCDPAANPAAGRATGSGINPDLKSRVACDPDLDVHMCVLTALPDALR